MDNYVHKAIRFAEVYVATVQINLLYYTITSYMYTLLMHIYVG